VPVLLIHNGVAKLKHYSPGQMCLSIIVLIVPFNPQSGYLGCRVAREMVVMRTPLALIADYEPTNCILQLEIATEWLP